MTFSESMNILNNTPNFSADFLYSCIQIFQIRHSLQYLRSNEGYDGRDPERCEEDDGDHGQEEQDVVQALRVQVVHFLCRKKNNKSQPRSSTVVHFLRNQNFDPQW